MKRLSVTIIAVCYIINTAFAQPNSKLVWQMKQLQKTYKEAVNLQFDIKYVYATESKPAVYLDSMKGKMAINGNNYRMLLNNTETIKNDRYIIHLFNDDKLIYLTKPSSEQQGTNPAALIDSAFANISDLTYSIDSSRTTKKLTIHFPIKSSYKKVVFTINALGFISKAKYVVKTEQLLPAKDQGAAVKEYDEYGIVEATFSNYKIGYEDPQLFDEKFFFVKNGNEYLPADKYKDFSIFLGSPNL